MTARALGFRAGRPGAGLPRSGPAIVAALAGRHERQDVVHALSRLAVTGEAEERDRKYAPVPDAG